jgi:hypothetical protein
LNWFQKVGTEIREEAIQTFHENEFLLAGGARGQVSFGMHPFDVVHVPGSESQQGELIQVIDVHGSRHSLSLLRQRLTSFEIPE